MSEALIGYRLVLPPGWLRIPLREDPQAVVAGLLDRSFADLPRDSYGPFRSELEKRIREMIRLAQDNEGIDLYVPVERMHGRIVPASFLVALLSFDTVETPEPQDVLAAYAGDSEGATIVEVGGAPSVRTEVVVPPVPDAVDESLLGSWRVTYLVPIVQGRDSWLTLTFSTAGDGQGDVEVAELLVSLFDAIVSTFRWTFE